MSRSLVDPERRVEALERHLAAGAAATRALGAAAAARPLTAAERGRTAQLRRETEAPRLELRALGAAVEEGRRGPPTG